MEADVYSEINGYDTCSADKDGTSEKRSIKLKRCTNQYKAVIS